MEHVRRCPWRHLLEKHMLYRRTVMKLAFGLAIGLGVAVSAAAALEDKADGNSAQVKVTWTDPAQFDEASARAPVPPGQARSVAEGIPQDPGQER
jgi:hypothetical protein